MLSPRSFNERTALVVGLPMTTTAYFAEVCGVLNQIVQLA